MPKCICINDKWRPETVPTSKWIKEGHIYTVIYTVTVLPQEQLAFQLEEIDLDDSCYPYEYFAANRFAFNDQELAKLIELMEDSMKMDYSLKELLKQTTIDNFSDFDNFSPFGNGGERVDFLYSDDIDTSKLDMYQLSHLRRYEFADKILPENIRCGDFACGTGYGSVMLSRKNRLVTGIDIDPSVIYEVNKRYEDNSKTNFLCLDLLDIDYKNRFDSIVSFETIEHFFEDDIVKLLNLYWESLKDNGTLLISVPYLQEECDDAKEMGFHLTFSIDENKISQWASMSGFDIRNIWYQNYDTHSIESVLDKKDFVICELSKIQ